MNWPEIKKQYPKAYALLLKSYSIQEIGNTLYWPQSNRVFIDRDLYDFFDSNSMLISVQPVWEREAPEWIARIGVVYWNKSGTGKGYYPSRRSAEDFIFTKAFHLLNDRL